MQTRATGCTASTISGEAVTAPLPLGVSPPQHNRLLAALPAEDFHRLAPLLREVRLVAGQLLNDPTTRQHQVYFPVTAVLSLQYVLEDGATSEIAGIGHEGVFGASLFIDEPSDSGHALVQCPGHAYCGAAEELKREFERGAAFQRLVLRHMHKLFMQVAVTSTCNRSHTVEQRLCRWLLGILERGTVQQLFATHERLACILGVRRESVTAIAGRLQDEGVIQYRRGRISILAPRELESRTCGCRSVLRQLHGSARQLRGPMPAFTPVASRLISVPARPTPTPAIALHGSRVVAW